MTQVGEGVAIPGLTSEVKEKLHSCDWTTCKKNHQKKPAYPKGGTVARNGSFKSDWVKARLEPWEVYGNGKDSRAELFEYREETPAAKYATTAAAMKHPEYHTQKHHLISVNLFDGVKKMGKNAELIGYDANHKKNGICLPSYKLDIIQHDLQCHRGSHPKALYNDKIKPLLANLERKSLEYCETDQDGTIERQAMLIDNLNRISDRIKLKIKSWTWLLRKDALVERKQSKERYQNLTLG